MTGKINKQIKPRLKRILYKSALWFLVISVSLTVIYRFVPVPVTPLALIRCVEQATDKNRKVRLDKDWVSMDQISPYMAQAVIGSEDMNFLEHNGFDFEAIEKAIQHNKSSKKKVGASTISQQTAKNVFLWNGRNWVRKGLEAYFTVLIETLWPKQRILEVYLNVIEFGDGIYGVEAASQAYYHKPASKLTRSEAAMLAAILPSPLRWSPVHPTKFLRKRQAHILQAMGYVRNSGEFATLSLN
jgi:monofunctional biosynthetic peptidoglycan transglycosylase